MAIKKLWTSSWVVNTHSHGLEQTLASMKSRLQVCMIEMGQDLQLLAADLSKTDQELVRAPVVVDLVWPKGAIIDPSRSTTRS